MCFLHKSDFDDCGVTQRNVQGALAALTELRLIREGPETPSRFVVQPGSTRAQMTSTLCLRQQLNELLHKRIFPQWSRQQRRFARNNIRDVCASSPSVGLGPTGPEAVIHAVHELAAHSAAHRHSIEWTGTLRCLRMVKPVNVGMAADLHGTFVNAAVQQRASLADVHRFFSRSDCVQERLSSRFGALAVLDEDVKTCGCSACLPGGALLAAGCY